MDNIIITNSLDAPGANIYAPSIIVDGSFQLAADQQAMAVGSARATAEPAARLTAEALAIPQASGITLGGKSLMSAANGDDVIAAVGAQEAPDRADRIAADQLSCGLIVGGCAVPAGKQVSCLSAKSARIFQLAFALSEIEWLANHAPAPLAITAELNTSEPRTIQFADNSGPLGSAACAPVGPPNASVAMAPSGDLVALNDPGIGHRIYRVSGLAEALPQLAEIAFSATSAETVEWADDSLHLFGYNATGDAVFITDAGAARCRPLS